MDWLVFIVLGVTAFVATNTDDFLLLVLFFSDPRYHARHVFMGQAVGIGLLVLISLAGALLALTVPDQWVGLLGVLPILIGARELSKRRHGTADVVSILPLDAGSHDVSGRRRVATVAGVTLANGGDNIGVYVPLFAAQPPTQTALLLAVFAVMLAVWLFGAYYLARRSVVAARVQRVGRAVFPYALIGVGMVILVESFSNTVYGIH